MQTSQFDLSVIVRTNGRSPQFLRRALGSIIAQTRLPAMIVVVNDSSDGALIKAELGQIDFRGISWQYLPRDVAIQPQPNRSTALNRGLAAAGTCWISFLDDDDTWMPQFLERVGSLLAVVEQRPDFGGVVTQTQTVEERLEAGVVVEKLRRPFNPGLLAVDLALLAKGNRFTLNSMVVNREVFASVGAYRDDLPVLEDWEFNVRAAAHFHFEVIPEALVCYHLRPSNDATANTSLIEHRRVKRMIQNEWLRHDRAAGRHGLGQLAWAGEIRGLRVVLDSGRAWRDRIRCWLGRPAQ